MSGVQGIAGHLLASEARNLHAIQKNAKTMIERVIDRLDDYPEAKSRQRAHLVDKDNEMRRLEEVLGAMGEDASSLKDSAMSVMGGLTGLMTGGLEDDILKTSMATYGLAEYEICAYEGMIALAEKAAQERAVPLLESCLAEERAMAEWLHAHMLPTLDRYLELRSQKGLQAAH
jgi:ferritin-like metal-binding protein YciE